MNCEVCEINMIVEGLEYDHPVLTVRYYCDICMSECSVEWLCTDSDVVDEKWNHV